MKKNTSLALILGAVVLVVLVLVFTVFDTKKPVPKPFAGKPDQSNTTQAPAAETSIQFENAVHNFGEINQHTTNTHVFKFTNTGTENLVISDAKGTCGCTKPDYPNFPIAPGESSEIKVTYRPGTQKGKQNKVVSITANTNPPLTRLTLKADVQVEEPKS